MSPEHRKPKGNLDSRGTTAVDLIAAALCVVVGVALSVLPHLIWCPRLGEPVWIADEDDLLYLSVASRAYFNHPFSLSDPVRAEGGATIYPWALFGPGIITARVLGLGPLAIDLVWRAWAGVSIALGWYLIIRHYVGRAWVSAALSVVLLADIGFVSGRLLVNQFWYFTELVTGRSGRLMMTAPALGYVPILAGIPGACPQWRIITPGLSFAFLLFHLWLVARARARPTWPRIVGAGLGFGLLVHTYFYYWTAAGLALVLALALDAGHRRIYFHTGWIGGLVGLPAIVANVLIKRSYPSDWLERTDVFVAIGRFEHLLRPKVALSLLVLTGLWLAWSRRRELIHLWALAAAGLILTHEQVLTALEIQNMHWLWYVAGPALSLLVVLLAAGTALRYAPWPRPVAGALLVFCGAHLAIGFYIRATESTQNPLCVAILNDYQRYRAQRLGPGDAPLAPNSVLAGDQRFVDLAAVLENQRPLLHYAVMFSPSTRNAEWYLRIALNGYLRGLDRSAFEAEQQQALDELVWGPWVRDPAQRAAVLAERLASYDRVAADPASAIAQLHVRYVALPAGQGPPQHVTEGWTRIEEGKYWDIWEHAAGHATARR